MARYYFNFRDGGRVINDVDGAEFDSFELAFEEAFNAAREMWQERLMRQQDPRKCAFEITDAAGRALAVVPFDEVLESCHARPRPSMPVIEVATHVERAHRLSRELGDLLMQTRETVLRSRALLKH